MHDDKARGRTLLLLRHGKSDWTQFTRDFQRPLKRRGIRGAQAIGKWLLQHQLIPDYLISSPAVRALHTAELVSQAVGLDQGIITQEPDIYEASVRDLLAVLSGIPSHTQCVMLVGHNPGLEDLILHLAVNRIPAADKLMPTAALASFNMPDDWTELSPGCAELISIIRPGSLPERPKAEQRQTC